MGWPDTLISFPRTWMSVVGKACSTTRSSSSPEPSTDTIGWLAGMTILDWASVDSAMNRPLAACSPCFPSRCT